MLPTSYGVIKTTLLDFPGLVAAVLFTPGCNLRCPWCQNPGLVQPPWDTTLTPWDEVLAFLDKRRGVLQGVVVTGGEPLFHPQTSALLAEIRARGYQIKLDTNGTLPGQLAQLDPREVDYVALDLKNAPSRYALSVGVPVGESLLAQTLALLAERWTGRSEVRLTWVPGLNRLEDLEEYAAFLKAGAALAGPKLPPVWVQSYRPAAPDSFQLDPSFAARAPTAPELTEVVARLQGLGVNAQLR